MIDTDDILEESSDARAAPYRVAIQAMLVAVTQSNRFALRDARKLLEDAMTETIAMAALVGAEDAIVQTSNAEGAKFARTKRQAIVPNVPFDDAVARFLARTPVTLRRAAERSAENIAKIYSNGASVAFARSAEASVTRRAQSLIAESLRRGDSEIEAGRRLALGVNDIRKRTKEWSESYARVVFRTNANTALTAGRFHAAQDPDVKRVMPAFEFQTAGDLDVRKNHEAADGVILRVDNPAWRKLAPPLGYNCRCQVVLVSLAQLQRMRKVGRGGVIRESNVPRTARPDTGFRHGGRPDLVLAGRT